MSRRFQKQDYTIGWICALPVELAVAVALLDETHEPLPQDEGDDNSYKLGRVGDYNIVIACLPSGVYGETSAAVVATHARRSFPYLKAALMVGIGGGVVTLRDIRLGDVVVSKPVPGFGGILQYDFGKTVEGGRFVQTKTLNKPPALFLNTVALLEAENILHQDDTVHDIMAQALEDGSLPKDFSRPPQESDKLFQAHYDHPNGNTSCKLCDINMISDRPPRLTDHPYIHYGLIASGNQVMRHGLTRDKLSREHGVLCFEMEAAGLVDELPSIVIRGICDYSDSHKNKDWQYYAALCAAAFAKAFLLRLPRKVQVDPADKTRSAESIKLNLPIAKGAAFGSYEDQAEPECLEGTRVDLRENIIKWANDSSEKSIFWLVGMAGTGKSTISRTIARSFQRSDRLGASFFFKRGEADRSHGGRFFTTIANHLATRFYSVATDVKKVIDNEPGITEQSLSEQFQKLIFAPLSQINPAPIDKNLVVMVDALDECAQKGEIRTIVYLLSRLKDVKTLEVKVFITSRPDFPIRSVFASLPGESYKDVVLHEVPKIEHDLSLFLEHEFAQIRQNHYLSLDWPGDSSIQQLVRMATPMFIYAATLCRFIGDENWDPEERIEKVLGLGTTEWQASHLYRTYLTVLEQIIIDHDSNHEKRFIEEFQHVVGTIISLATPLSILSLARLLAMSPNIIKSRLRPLHSILHVSENVEIPVRVFHQSFRDFLLEKSVERRSKFSISEKESHRTIYRKCIALMSGKNGLRRDICDLKEPGALRIEICQQLVQDRISPDLQYACRYWVYHLKLSEDRLVDDCQTHKFLQSHLLYWLEAMSLLNCIAQTIKMLEELSSVTNGKSSKISDLLYDIKRFILQNRHVIDQAPLQTYFSALVFAPKNSRVKSIFASENKLRNSDLSTQVQDDWSELLQRLENHRYSVDALAFSYPDSAFLASGSWDGYIRIWDTATGSWLQTLSKHLDAISTVAFSYSDSNILASGSTAANVIVWDISTGSTIHVLGGHYGPITKVFFTYPESETLVSASYHKIKVWDTVTGHHLQDFSTYTVSVVGSYHKKSLLASSLYNGDIEIWHQDSRTWSKGNTIKGNMYEHNHVNALAFSRTNPDILACGSNKIRIWDISCGVLIHVLEGYITSISSLSFSSTSGTLASASNDAAITLWDVLTGLPVNEIQENTYNSDVQVVEFSFAGHLLASASRRKSISIWDTGFHVPSRPSAKHKKPRPFVEWLGFSPNGRILVSVLSDATIALWDAELRSMMAILESPHHGDISVTFSSDSDMFAVISRSCFINTITAWNIANASQICHLKSNEAQSHKDPVFAPNNQTLASKTYTGSVLIWNIRSGALVYEFKDLGVRDIDGIVAYSPDSKLIASTTSNHKIKIWETGTGLEIHALEPHPSSITMLKFSPANDYLASSSEDNTVTIWQVTSAEPLQMIHAGALVRDIRFPPRSGVQAADESACPIDLILWKDDQNITAEEIVEFKDEWLVIRDKRFLWLPTDYRVELSAISKDTLALGHKSGTITFVNLNLKC